jgi:hypothetical protein
MIGPTKISSIFDSYDSQAKIKSSKKLSFAD